MNITWPLEGCTDTNPLEGGFGYLDLTDDGATFHPGCDLNSGPSAQDDCGAAIVAPVPMTVRKVIFGVQNGYGNHIWAQADTGEWLHFCHLTTAPVPEGLHLDKGAVFATCGRTNGWPNGWPYCHLHFEVMRQQPQNWEFWPKGWSRAAVEALYLDPEAWLAQQAASQVEGDPTVTDTERQEMRAQIDNLNGVNTELNNQVAALHEEVSHLRDDVIPAIEAAPADQAVLDDLKERLGRIAALAVGK